MADRKNLGRKVARPSGAFKVALTGGALQRRAETQRSIVRAALVAGLLLTAAPRAQAFSDPSEALSALNAAARAAYAAGKDKQLERVGPVILVGSEIIFIRSGTETNASYTPPLYTVLKSISHLSLGTIVVLQPFAGTHGTAAEWRPHLQAMRAQALLVEPQLEALGLSGNPLVRNRHLIRRMVDFIDGVLTRDSFPREDIETIAHDLAPLLLANADLAAKVQIEALHAAVETWRAEISPEEWDKTRVFVLGPRMPRRGNLQYGYFTYALGKEAADTRLIYAENVFDKAGAIKLLATILTDRALALVTFDEELRMDRDLLADAADVHLRRLFGKLGRECPAEKASDICVH